MPRKLITAGLAVQNEARICLTLPVVFAGILGGLVAAATAFLAPDANAPVMKFDGSKQVSPSSASLLPEMSSVMGTLLCTIIHLAY